MQRRHERTISLSVGTGLSRRRPTRRDPHGATAPLGDRTYEDLLQALMLSNEKQAARQGSFAYMRLIGGRRAPHRGSD